MIKIDDKVEQNKTLLSIAMMKINVSNGELYKTHIYKLCTLNNNKDIILMFRMSTSKKMSSKYFVCSLYKSTEYSNTMYASEKIYSTSMMDMITWVLSTFDDHQLLKVSNTEAIKLKSMPTKKTDIDKTETTVIETVKKIKPVTRKEKEHAKLERKMFSNPSMWKYTD